MGGGREGVLDQRALVCASELCDRLEKSSPPRGIYDVVAALRYPPPSPRRLSAQTPGRPSWGRKSSGEGVACVSFDTRSRRCAAGLDFTRVRYVICVSPVPTGWVSRYTGTPVGKGDTQI